MCQGGRSYPRTGRLQPVRAPHICSKIRHEPRWRCLPACAHPGVTLHMTRPTQVKTSTPIVDLRWAGKGENEDKVRAVWDQRKHCVHARALLSQCSRASCTFPQLLGACSSSSR